LRSASRWNNSCWPLALCPRCFLGIEADADILEGMLAVNFADVEGTPGDTRLLSPLTDKVAD
jgi:hypothetical protein